jgi:hypothetical protein
LTQLDDIITGETSTCIHCGEPIAAVVDPTSGCVDWGSSIFTAGKPEDFGCSGCPDTDDNGTGAHSPGDGHTPVGFKILVDSRSYWERIEAAKR